MAGFEERTWAILLSDLVALSNAIFTIVSILLIDRVGRRPLLLSTLVGVVLGLALLGAAFFVKAGNTGKTERRKILRICSAVGNIYPYKATLRLER
jgi:SP family myo-inositol transporter-like MFS transporter 13